MGHGSKQGKKEGLFSQRGQLTPMLGSSLYVLCTEKNVK